MPGVEDLLSQVDDDGLVELLEARPDATRVPQPRNLAELAERLDSVSGVVEVLRRLPRPASQLIEALLALGEGLTPEQFGARIGHDLSSPAGRWLDVLRRHGLVWADAEGRLHTVRSASLVFPSPLGLGPRLAEILALQNVDALRRALREFGVKPATHRADVVAELIANLSSPDLVRSVAARAPREIGDDLRRWVNELVAPGALPFGYGVDPDAWEFDEPDTAFDLDGFDPRLRPAASEYDYPPLRVVADAGAWRAVGARESYHRRQATERWTVQHGLAWPIGWNAVAVLPAEVVVALRGEEMVVPFDTEPPVMSTAPRTAPADAFGSVLSATANLAVAVFDRLTRAPLPSLKSGGVGVRELKRLQTELGAEPRSIRLVLELLADLDAIEAVASTWGPSAAGSTWRGSDPAERMMALIQAWLAFNGAPTQQVDQDGKTVAALAGPRCPGCAAARSALLEAQATLDDDVRAETPSLSEFTLWSRPYVHAVAEPGDAPFARVLDEAHQLGVTYDLALTDLGRALGPGDRAAALASLRRILPATSDQALIGADLTAVVVGTPSATLSALLDATADRESTGGATVWRFKPASIRRALDGGHTAEGIVEGLSAAATSGLPQSLRYLVGDLARRHGSVRVADAVATLRSDDVALLAEIAADRRLRKLGLRLLAPTVLAAESPTDTVLTTLRAHGYLPMPDRDETATATAPGPSADRAAPDQLAELRLLRKPAPVPPPETPVALDELVRRLRLDTVVAESPSELGIARFARRLSPFEVRLLGHASEAGSRVAIDYESESGALTHRTISSVELFGDAVHAWCELRSAERWFRLDRIRAVAPADG